MKIKKIEIKGFRGIQNNIELDLEYKSCLIYGENGCGKSSITDAIEWFYYDRIEHLSNEEIDRKGGITAIRNINISADSESYISLNFSNSDYDCKKIIDSKFKVNSNNNKPSFNQYIEKTRQENLILRYQDIANFILATKTERLNRILEIIGFNNVLKIRDILRKGKNEIDRMTKVKNFDSEISRREGEIMEKLGEMIVDDNSFVNKVNTLIQPLNLEPISTINDIETILNRLTTIDDTPIIKKCDYLEKTKNAIKSIEEKVPKLTELYQEFFSSYNQLLQDIESLKQLFLENLWNVSLNLLQNNWSMGRK